MLVWKGLKNHPIQRSINLWIKPGVLWISSKNILWPSQSWLIVAELIKQCRKLREVIFLGRFLFIYLFRYLFMCICVLQIWGSLPVLVIQWASGSEQGPRIWCCLGSAVLEVNWIILQCSWTFRAKPGGAQVLPEYNPEPCAVSDCMGVSYLQGIKLHHCTLSLAPIQREGLDTSAVLRAYF